MQGESNGVDNVMMVMMRCRDVASARTNCVFAKIFPLSNDFYNEIHPMRMKYRLVTATIIHSAMPCASGRHPTFFTDAIEMLDPIKNKVAVSP